MRCAFNTMIKNEGRLLDVVLPIWAQYPIDVFVFYDDNSTDNSIDVIKKHLNENRFIIINDKLVEFNEGYQRQRMIDISKQFGVEYIFAIDADELLSSSIIKNFDLFLEDCERHDMQLYWYNCVNGSLRQFRNDPSYVNNYRTFVLPVSNMGHLDVSQNKYHTPRTPKVTLPRKFSNEYGIIHLQAVNTKFYAIKQLWYKHHEFVIYHHSCQFINERYDPVVNGLVFNEVKTPSEIIDGIDIDLSVFDGMEIEKGYLDFIMKNYNEELITFGQQYLNG